MASPRQLFAMSPRPDRISLGVGNRSSPQTELYAGAHRTSANALIPRLQFADAGRDHFRDINSVRRMGNSVRCDDRSSGIKKAFRGVARKNAVYGNTDRASAPSVHQLSNRHEHGFARGNDVVD